MSIKCGEITKFFEELAPTNLAEDWDNVGLLLGSKLQDINRILVCLDVTNQVADEAVEKKADLIVSHHPLIFKGIKRLNEDDLKGKILYKLIRNNIGVYSAHTNLDVAVGGVNDVLAKKLQLSDVNNLNRYREEKMYKFVVFVPEENGEDVRNAMCRAGAGHIGNYSDCSYMTGGTGSLKPLEGSNPYIGQSGRVEKVKELRIESIVPKRYLKSVISAVIDAHPYEEVAYDVYELELPTKEYGLGRVGVLKESMDMESFISHVKSSLGLDRLRIIGKGEKRISKVAVFGGSFDGDLSGVLREGADVLITGDIKYHMAQDNSEMGLCVIDAGHFSTEHVIVSELVGLIKERFSGIDVIGSEVENDPIIIS